MIEAIKPLAKSTQRKGVIGSLGGFGGLFDIKAAGYKDPILIAATDGVGTKLKVAQDLVVVERQAGFDMVQKVQDTADARVAEVQRLGHIAGRNQGG